MVAYFRVAYIKVAYFRVAYLYVAYPKVAYHIGCFYFFHSNDRNKPPFSNVDIAEYLEGW